MNKTAPEARVENRLSSFQRKAAMPGGKPRDQAIEDATRAVKAMTHLSLNAIRSNISFIDSVCMNEEFDVHMLNAAYQKSNEIGEISSILDIDALPDVSRSLSELIARMLAERKLHRRHFEVHIQALRYAFAYGNTSMDEENSAVLISKLAKVVNRISDENL